MLGLALLPGRVGGRIRAAAAAVLLLAACGAATAQEPSGVRFEVKLSPDSAPDGARAPILRLEHLLDDDRWLGSLRSGLPIRLHYEVEIWRSRGGWFDAYQLEAAWDVVVRHEPLLEQYTLLTISGGGRQERRYATLDALGAALGFAYRVSIRPNTPGEYYYAGSVEITTLSDSDIDELERFLEGELGEVAQGRESFGDAVGRGATRFLLRLAGLPSVRLEARSAQFRVR